MSEDDNNNGRNWGTSADVGRRGTRTPTGGEREGREAPWALAGSQARGSLRALVRVPARTGCPCVR